MYVDDSNVSHKRDKVYEAMSEMSLLCDIVAAKGQINQSLGYVEFYVPGEVYNIDEPRVDIVIMMLSLLIHICKSRHC